MDAFTDSGNMLCHCIVIVMTRERRHFFGTSLRSNSVVRPGDVQATPVPWRGPHATSLSSQCTGCLWSPRLNARCAAAGEACRQFCQRQESTAFSALVTGTDTTPHNAAAHPMPNNVPKICQHLHQETGSTQQWLCQQWSGDPHLRRWPCTPAGTSALEPIGYPGKNGGAGPRHGHC